jgi:hypothetical protein
MRFSFCHTFAWPHPHAYCVFSFCFRFFRAVWNSMNMKSPVGGNYSDIAGLNSPVAMMKSMSSSSGGGGGGASAHNMSSANVQALPATPTATAVAAATPATATTVTKAKPGGGGGGGGASSKKKTSTAAAVASGLASPASLADGAQPVLMEPEIKYVAATQHTQRKGVLGFAEATRKMRLKGKS